MRITIKTLSGETFPLDIEAVDTILSIKEKIQSLKNFEIASQKLLRKGALLQDEKTVFQLGIHKGDNLVVMVNVKKQPPTQAPQQPQQAQRYDDPPMITENSKEIWFINEDLNRIGREFNKINNNFSTHQILFLIHAAHHAFGQWSPSDQANMILKGFAASDIKENKTLLWVLELPYDNDLEYYTEIAEQISQIQARLIVLSIDEDSFKQSSDAQFLYKFFIIVSKIDPLKNLVIKYRASAYNNPVSQLAGLKYMLNLKFLQISICDNRSLELKSLSNLQYLVNLTTLKLNFRNGNFIDLKLLSDLQYLVNLTTLKLNFVDNKIQDLSPLSILQNLVKLTSLSLKLKDNRIIDLKPLSNLQYLVNLTDLQINLSLNQISDLKPFSNLQNLVNLKTLVLDFSKNMIIDIQPLLNMNNLVNLEMLSLDLYQNNYDSEDDDSGDDYDNENDNLLQLEKLADQLRLIFDKGYEIEVKRSAYELTLRKQQDDEQ